MGKTFRAYFSDAFRRGTQGTDTAPDNKVHKAAMLVSDSAGNVVFTGAARGK